MTTETSERELTDAEWAEREMDRIRCIALVKGRHDPTPRQCKNPGAYYLGDYYCRIHMPPHGTRKGSAT